MLFGELVSYTLKGRRNSSFLSKGKPHRFQNSPQRLPHSFICSTASECGMLCSALRIRKQYSVPAPGNRQQVRGMSYLNAFLHYSTVSMQMKGGSREEMGTRKSQRSSSSVNLGGQWEQKKKRSFFFTYCNFCSNGF